MSLIYDYKFEKLNMMVVPETSRVANSFISICKSSQNQ